MAYEKMNKEVKKAWVAALRSGDYKQGTGQLRDTENNFCCLGVLCNIHAQQHPYVAKKSTQTRYDGKSFTPSKRVKDWAGIDDTVENKLVVMNDDSGKTFKEIADWIVNNL